MFRFSKNDRLIAKGMPDEFAWAVSAAQIVAMKSNLEFEVMDRPEHARMLELVKQAHQEINTRGQIELATRFAFMDAPEDKAADAASWGLRQIIFAMSCAGNSGIEPFASQPVEFHEDPEPERDWSILPENLTGLKEHAERLGHLQFEGDMLDFLDQADETDREYLRKLALFYSSHTDLIEAFNDREDLRDTPEQNRTFYLGLLLDHAGLLE